MKNQQILQIQEEIDMVDKEITTPLSKDMLTYRLLNEKKAQLEALKQSNSKTDQQIYILSTLFNRFLNLENYVSVPNNSRSLKETIKERVFCWNYKFYL